LLSPQNKIISSQNIDVPEFGLGLIKAESLEESEYAPKNVYVDEELQAGSPKLA
jgi:hypothetical protein